MILVCGIPNAGKTTYSKQFKDVIHYDDLQLTTKGRYKKINEFVAKGECVVDGVFGKRENRCSLIQSCPKDEKKVCVWLNTSLSVCLEREKKYRNRSLFMVKSHYNSFEPPTLDEGWDEIIIIRGNNEQSINNEK